MWFSLYIIAAVLVNELERSLIAIFRFVDQNLSPNVTCVCRDWLNVPGPNSPLFVQARTDSVDTHQYYCNLSLILKNHFPPVNPFQNKPLEKAI